MPKDVIERRLAGGYHWQDTVRRVIRSEEAEVQAVTELIQSTGDARTLHLYTALLTRKIERLGWLNELLRYGERDA